MTSGSDICCCTSAWRASICSTKDSITPPSLGCAPSPLGGDFDSDEILVGRGPRVLEREHGLHRCDGDGQLLVVGLAGRELLEHHPGRHQRLDPGLAAVLAGPLDDLE